MTKEEERRVRAIELATNYTVTKPEATYEEFMLIVKEFYDFIQNGTTPQGTQQ